MVNFYISPVEVNKNEKFYNKHGEMSCDCAIQQED